MAVAFDAVSSATPTPGTTSPHTWTHTGVGANLAVVAAICLDEATSSTTVACTYNGVSMTLIGQIAAGAAGNNGILYFFGIANAPTGAQTVSFTFSGTTDVCVGASVSWTGAGLTFGSAFGNFQPTPLSSGQGTGANPGLGINTHYAGSQAFCVIASAATAITSMGGGAQRFLDANTGSGACSSIVGSNSAGTGGIINFTSSIASATFAIAGLEILPPIAPPLPPPEPPGRGAPMAFRYNRLPPAQWQWVNANGFEMGTNGTSLSPNNTAGTNTQAPDSPAGAVTIGAGCTCAFSNVVANSGSLSMGISEGSTATAVFAQWNFPNSPSTYFRFYVYMTALPVADDSVIQWQNNGNRSCVFQLSAAGKWIYQDNAFGETVFTNAIPLNTWVRLDGSITWGDGTAANGSVTMNYYPNNLPSTAALETHTLATTNTGPAANQVQIGWPSAGHTFQPLTYWDDIAVGNVSIPPVQNVNAYANAAPALATGVGNTIPIGVGPKPTAALATGVAFNASVPIGVTANAGLASAIGTAYSPSINITFTAGLASGTGAANAPPPGIGPKPTAALATGTANNTNINVSVTAGVAQATGAALSPNVNTVFPAGLASGTGAALNPGAGVGPTPTAALATGAAFNATGGSTGVTASPSAALATGAAFNASVTITPKPTAALATGTANNAGNINLAITAGAATAIGTALSAGVALTFPAGLASATGAAFNTASVNLTITAGLASATGAALNPGIAVTFPAGLASAAGAAFNPTPTVGPKPAAALATGAALQPNVNVVFPAGPASAAGTASNPGAGTGPTPTAAIATGAAFNTSNVNLVVTAGVATATGAALQPNVSLTAVETAATATGAALAPSLAAVINAGVASATGVAINAAVNTTGGANAGLATATGAAFSANVNLVVNAGLASATGAANGITPTTGPTPTAATATGAAFQPKINVAFTAGSAAATGAAFNPGAGVGPKPTAALATGVAFNPSIGFLYNQDFENGTSGTNITTANSGGGNDTAFNEAVIGTGTTLQYSNTVAHSGTQSGGVAVGSTATAVYMGWDFNAVPTTYFRFYVYLTAYPVASDAVVQWTNSSGRCCIFQIESTGQWAFQDNAFSLHTFSDVIPLNTWVRMDGSITWGTNSGGGTVIMNYYAQAEEIPPDESHTFSNAKTGTAATEVQMGWPFGGNALQPLTYWDDIGVASTPLPPVIPVRNPQNLGGSFAYLNLGGTAVPVTYDGTASTVNNTYGGGAVPVTIDAVLTLQNFGGTAATVANTYGGTITLASYGGGATPVTIDASLTLQNFGGTAITVNNTYGGSVTLPNFGGGAVPVTIDAALTLPNFGGTAASLANTYGGTVGVTTYDATLVGWTMQVVSLTLAENNDESVNVAITQNGSALNLTSATINMYLKTAAGTADGSALLLSSAGGSPAITITNAAGGLCTVAIPRADLTAETNNFYRIDVVFSGLQNTAIYGPIVWITL